MLSKPKLIQNPIFSNIKARKVRSTKVHTTAEWLRVEGGRFAQYVWLELGHLKKAVQDRVQMEITQPLWETCSSASGPYSLHLDIYVNLSPPAP